MVETWNSEQFIDTEQPNPKEEKPTDKTYPITSNQLECILGRDIQLTRKERKLYKQGQRLLEPNEECIKTAEELCQDISDDFQLQFLQIWNPENKERSIYFSDDSVDYMLNNDFLIPHFKLITGNKRGKIVEKMELKHPYRYIGDSVILIFELPEILTTPTKDDESIPEEIRNFQREGGKGMKDLQEALIQIIWENITKYHEKGQVLFQRLNLKKQHKKGKFYYVWKVRRKNTNVETDQEESKEATLNNNLQHP